MKLRSYEIHWPVHLSYRRAINHFFFTLMQYGVREFVASYSLNCLQLFLCYSTDFLKNFLILYVLVLLALRRAHMFCCESTTLLRQLCTIVHHLLDCSGDRFLILPGKQVSTEFELTMLHLIFLSLIVLMYTSSSFSVPVTWNNSSKFEPFSVVKQ